MVGLALKNEEGKEKDKSEKERTYVPVDATKVTAKVTVRKCKKSRCRKERGKGTCVTNSSIFEKRGRKSPISSCFFFCPVCQIERGENYGRAFFIGGRENTFWAWPDGRQTPNQTP